MSVADTTGVLQFSLVYGNFKRCFLTEWYSERCFKTWKGRTRDRPIVYRALNRLHPLPEAAYSIGSAYHGRTNTKNLTLVEWTKECQSVAWIFDCLIVPKLQFGFN